MKNSGNFFQGFPEVPEKLFFWGMFPVFINRKRFPVVGKLDVPLCMERVRMVVVRRFGNLEGAPKGFHCIF